jgi:enoyl-CoA hydratase
MIVELKLQAPGKNALGTPVFDWLQSEITKAAGNPILLTGDGDAFSAGLNLKEVASFETHAQMQTFLEKLDKTVSMLFDYPGPTVALIQGHAIAGGCVVANCCDFRIATNNPKTRIGLNEVALGVSFPPATWSIMNARVPARHQTEVFLGAELFDVQKALHLGLIDEISDQAEERARQRLAKLATYVPEAYADAKAELRRGVTSISAEEHQRFYQQRMPLWLSDQVRKTLSAALKR